MQTKKQKQEKVLNNLISQLQDEQKKRKILQSQMDYGIVMPSNTETRLSIEVNSLKHKLGLSD